MIRISGIDKRVENSLLVVAVIKTNQNGARIDFRRLCGKV